MLTLPAVTATPSTPEAKTAARDAAFALTFALLDAGKGAEAMAFWHLAKTVLV